MHAVTNRAPVFADLALQAVDVRDTRANSIIASSTPPATPIARLPVATVSTTVTIITVVSDFGMRVSIWGDRLRQFTVVSAATIITPANATIGIFAISPLIAVTRTSRTRAATAVETRVRPWPIFTLTTVWAIIAQPAMPP
jgi:hypothetical protein